MKNKYVNIFVPCDEKFKEIIPAFCSDLPFLGITEKENGLEFSFYKRDWDNNLENTLKNILTNLNPEFNSEQSKFWIEIIDEQNWNENWEREVPAFHINDRIGIAPSWKMHELTEEIQLEINPKMSFGTGSHATTRLMCRLLDGIVEKGESWIDAGTGTGVLAILEDRLGASEVFAFDNNEWSVDNTRDNFALNKLNNPIKLELLELDNYELPQCDGISANILTHVILNNLEKFVNSVKNGAGKLVFSGILAVDKQKVINSVKDFGFTLEKYIEEDEWSAYYFVRNK